MTDEYALRDQVVDADAVAFTIFTRFEGGQWRGEAWVGHVMIWAADLGPIAPMTPEDALENTKMLFAERLSLVIGLLDI